MSGAPRPAHHLPASQFLSFGAKPHVVPPAEPMVFDAMRGGWVAAEPFRPTAPLNPRSMGASSTQHYESTHHTEKWNLDLKREAALGFAPPEWSTTAAMSDERQNGQSLFDARFRGNAMARARVGRPSVGATPMVAAGGM